MREAPPGAPRTRPSLAKGVSVPGSAHRLGQVLERELAEVFEAKAGIRLGQVAAGMGRLMGTNRPPQI